MGDASLVEGHRVGAQARGNRESERHLVRRVAAKDRIAEGDHDPRLVCFPADERRRKLAIALQNRTDCSGAWLIVDVEAQLRHWARDIGSFENYHAALLIVLRRYNEALPAVPEWIRFNVDGSNAGICCLKSLSTEAGLRDDDALVVRRALEKYESSRCNDNSSHRSGRGCWCEPRRILLRRFRSAAGQRAREHDGAQSTDAVASAFPRIREESARLVEMSCPPNSRSVRPV
jgi:hypothetical protein